MDGMNGLFQKFQPLVGSDWLRRLPKEEREAFSYIGRMAAQHGRLGGIARTALAQRDDKGRFIKSR